MPEPSATMINVTAVAANAPAIAALQERGVRPASAAGTSIKAVSLMSAPPRKFARCGAARYELFTEHQTGGGDLGSMELTQFCRFSAGIAEAGTVARLAWFDYRPASEEEMQHERAFAAGPEAGSSARSRAGDAAATRLPAQNRRV